MRAQVIIGFKKLKKALKKVKNVLLNNLCRNKLRRVIEEKHRFNAMMNEFKKHMDIKRLKEKKAEKLRLKKEKEK